MPPSGASMIWSDIFLFLKTLSKEIKAHIPNLKPVLFEPLQEGGETQIKENKIELAHETLLELLSDFDPDKVRPFYSLYINRSQPIQVLSVRIDEHVRLMRELTIMLEDDTVITKQSILDYRKDYDDDIFFTTFDGFSIKRTDGMYNVKIVLTEFAVAYSNAYAMINKTMTTKHNLGVLNSLVNDSLEFVKGIRYVR